MTRLRPFLLVLPCAASAVLMTGCSLTSVGPATKAERTYGVDGAVTALAATTPGGNIEIVPVDAGGSVKVTEKYVYDQRKPAPTHSFKDGRLTLTADDCEDAEGRCEVGYKVLLPRGASVDLHTSGGDITVRGAAGGIAAETSGGRHHRRGLRRPHGEGEDQRRGRRCRPHGGPRRGVGQEQRRGCHHPPAEGLLRGRRLHQRWQP